MASTRVEASPGPASLTEVPPLAPTQGLSSATTSPLDPRLSCALTIPEEDESNGETGSESLEPITPTDAQFHDSFRHHDTSVDAHPTTPQPTTINTKAIAMNNSTPTNARPQLTNQVTAPAHSSHSSEGTTTARNGIGARVGSFVRNKLHRAPSNNKPSGEPQKPTLDTTNIPRASPAPVPASAVMPRRLSSWSIKNSPRSSASNSPPSPSSPSSTMNEENKGKLSAPQHGHGHSSSTSRIPQPDEKPNRGVTWGAFGSSNKEKGSRSRPFRRRSASTEIAPRLRTQNSDDPTIGLVDTFSKPALEGTGMKARRLSTSLPDEFNVDYCELDKEFKSTSVVPGKRGRRCGIGATAEVRIMAKKGWGDDLVAVKEFRARDKTENEEEYLKKIKSEFSIANSLHHPNIVSTVRLCTHHGRWNHVMEFCNHGEVYAMVERGLFHTHYKLEDRLCFFKQLLRAVEYLHSHGIAHRDIKLENLLMDKDGHMKLSDFGVSEVFCGAHPGLRESGGQCGQNMGEIRKCAPSICGSLPYIAPEVLDKKDNYDPRCLDVWSCAILFLTMTFGGSPWEAAKVEHQHYAKFKTGWDDWLVTHPDGQIKDEVDGSPKCGPLFRKIEPPALRRLLFKMMHPIPEKRITMREIMQLTYVKNIECCCAESFEDTKCSVNASAKNSGKAATKMVLKKHHHAPPKEISKFRQGLTHRFDMGEGW